MKFKNYVIAFILVLNSIIILQGNEIKDLKAKKYFFENKIEFYLVDNEDKMENGFFSFSYKKNLLDYSDNTEEKYKNKIDSIDIINLGNLYNNYTNYRLSVINFGAMTPLFIGLGIFSDAFGYALDQSNQIEKLIYYNLGGYLLGAGIVTLAFFVVYLIYVIINYNQYMDAKNRIIKKLNGLDLSSKNSKIGVKFDIVSGRINEILQ